MRTLLLLIALPVLGCAPSWQPDFDRLEARFVLPPREPGPSPDLDAQLSQALDAETLVKIALARNPEVRELAARVRAQLEEVRRVGSLDDPMLTLKTEELPFRPNGMSGDRANVLGLEQRLPFPGTLGLRAESALRAAEAMAAMVEDRERDIVARVRKAFVEYASMTRHLAIHTEHVQILSELEKISDAKFRNGVVSQQDVLKPQLELVMLRNELIDDAQKIESAQAMLNELLARPSDAPLGPPRALDSEELALDFKALGNQAMTARAEIRAAELRARAAATGADAAQRESDWPEITLGAEAMQMPGEPDAWSAMLGVNLPWLTGKHQAETRKMRAMQRAEEIAVEGVRNRVRAEVRDAFLRVDAARRSVALFKGELVPKSRQGVEVSRTSYEKDKASFLDVLDAERSLRDVKLDHTRALAAYASALADLERAVGADLRRSR